MGVQEEIGEMVTKLKESYGSESAIVFSENDADYHTVEAIPTPSLKLNQCLRIGGFPVGRVVEVFAPEGTGKTTLAIQTAAKAQANGGYVGIINAEYAFDPQYAEALGLDISRVIVMNPNNGEEAIEMARDLALMFKRHNKPSMIVFDSIAALVPKAEIEGDIADANMGLHARLVGKLMRSVTPNLNLTCFVVINQIRMKLGVMFGSPETTPGGNAIKFFASLRLDVRIREKHDDYNDVEIKVVKTRFGKPYQSIKTRLVFGKGFDSVYDMIDVAEDLDIIQKNGGGVYSLNSEKLAQGRDKLWLKLKSEVDLYEKILGLIDARQ